MISFKVLVFTLVGNFKHHFFKIGSLVTAVFSASNAFIFFNPKINGTPWRIKRINGFHKWP